MDLITPEEIDALPDDPRTAFVEFEWILRQRIRHALEDNSSMNYDPTPAKERYVMLIQSAATEYNVDDVPIFKVHDYGEETFAIVYRAAIGASTRLSLQNKRLRSADTVVLGKVSKARLRAHLDELRAALAAADIPEARRKALEAKLSQFASELENEKSNLATLLKVAAAFAAFAAGVGQTQDAIIKLPETISAITVLLGTAKADEEEQHAPPPVLPQPEEQKALPAPTALWPSAPFAFDLDDDVPF